METEEKTKQSWETPEITDLDAKETMSGYVHKSWTESEDYSLS